MICVGIVSEERSGLRLDVTVPAFYALVCAALNLAGPRLGTPLVTFGIGALVGIVAAAVLQSVRLFIGG
ncbi:hypothetical protein [Marivita sp. XM-24bin2]|jgi:hypothetical protein|uniref:hypothetical protein n=1 Tax=unclassified Marivita TaxID=2632480 RepID=UPI000D79D565|nr:hypothetical protein [Marivita sp. XM-24bin2]MCR9107620.1 hypothetical protein [Paracoccaceae bacterium]PWL33728.1 MAG: hypothetical protein DCO97_18030 [Marivita sp. XM-24bin2]